jgi:hypothetical protein
MPSRDSVTRFVVSSFFIDYLSQAPDFKYRISSRILAKILTTQGAPPVSMTLVANGKNFFIEGLKSRDTVLFRLQPYRMSQQWQ